MQSSNETFQILLQQLLQETWSTLLQEYQTTISTFESRLQDMDVENRSLREANTSLQEQAKNAAAEKAAAEELLQEERRRLPKAKISTEMASVTAFETECISVSPSSPSGDVQLCAVSENTQQEEVQDDEVDPDDEEEVESISSKSSGVPVRPTKSMMSVSNLFKQMKSNESTFSFFKGDREAKDRESERKELKSQNARLTSEVQNLRRELQAIKVRNSMASGALRTPTDVSRDPVSPRAMPTSFASHSSTLSPVLDLPGKPPFTNETNSFQPRSPSSEPMTMTAWEDTENQMPVLVPKPPTRRTASLHSENDVFPTPSLRISNGVPRGFQPPSQAQTKMDSTEMVSKTRSVNSRTNSLSSTEDSEEDDLKVCDIWLMSSVTSPRFTINRASRQLLSCSMSDSDSIIEDDLSSNASELGVVARLMKQISLLVVSPTTIRSMLWEVVGVLFIIYDAVVIPMLTLRIPESAFTLTIGWLQCIYWSMAILVSFLTGYIDEKGLIILELRRVASRYTRSWLAFDVVLACLDWMELGGSCDGGTEALTCVITYLQILRLLRLVHLLRARLLTGFIIKYIRSESVILIARVMMIMIFMVWTTHLIACTWYGIGRLGGSKETSWVYFHDLENMSFGERYTRSFHAALALFFGEHTSYSTPRSMVERTFIIWVLLVSFMMSAWFVSSITSAMTRLSIVSGQDTAHFTALSRYLSDNGISRRLAQKVKRNAQHAVNEQRIVTPEKNIELLPLISEPLRCELHYEIHCQTLTVHPFFRYYERLNSSAFRKICHHGIKRISFCTGDNVFCEGESPSVPRMLFCKTGKLSYCQGDSHLPGSKRQRVGNKNWMCEAVLWTQKWTHRGSLTATSDCLLVALDAHWFQSIVSKYPTTHVGIYAANFVHDMVSGSPEDITDVGEESVELEQLLQAAFPSSCGEGLLVSGAAGTLLQNSAPVGTGKNSVGSNRRPSCALLMPNLKEMKEEESWFSRTLQRVGIKSTQKEAW